MDSSDLIRVPCPLCEKEASELERVIEGFTVERCRECGHVFMNPQPPPANLAEHYKARDTQRLIELYARIAATPSVQRRCEERLDWLDRVRPERGRLLDFACADGFFFEKAQRRGWDAHGVDLGEWTREAARTKGLENLHVGNLIELEFPDGYFDVVYAAQALEHLPNPRRDVREFLRILKPGGLLYVDVPNYHTLSIVLGRDDFELNAPPQHVNYFTPGSLARLLQSEGFRNLKVSTSGGLKWENLIGRSTNSEIREVYVGGPSYSGPVTAQRSRPTVVALLKRVLLASVVKPLMYERLLIGMTLEAVAYRPRG